MLAIGVTVIFVIVGILYLAGAVITTGGGHNKRALVCFVVAVVAAIVAYFTRPQAQVAR
jgi:hypothetical protein